MQWFHDLAGSLYKVEGREGGGGGVKVIRSCWMELFSRTPAGFSHAPLRRSLPSVRPSVGGAVTSFRRYFSSLRLVPVRHPWTLDGFNDTSARCNLNKEIKEKQRNRVATPCGFAHFSSSVTFGILLLPSPPYPPFLQASSSSAVHGIPRPDFLNDRIKHFPQFTVITKKKIKSRQTKKLWKCPDFDYVTVTQ